MILRGVFPPMLTPFHDDGSLDADGFVKNIERWNGEGLAGYVVLGSNSEAAYLSEREKLTLVELTVATAARGMTVIAGTGLESTRETIRLTNEAAKRGAHATLVLTPSFYVDRMDDRAMIAHFTSLADHSDIPILIYSVPKFTHITISVDAVRVLSAHPNIVGMKDSSGDLPRLEALKKAVPQEFNLLVGTANAWFPALAMGIQGGVMALANCAPKECVRVRELYNKGKVDEAKALHQRLVPVNTAVTMTFGVAGLKYAASLCGYRGGAVRSPLQPLSDQDRQIIRSILSTAGLVQGSSVG